MSERNVQEPNTLGKTSFNMGIASIVLVFGLGVCAFAGGAQIPVAVNLLFVCGASSAFLGLIGAFVGLVGLFGRNRPKATALVGIVLGMSGLCLFLGILNGVGG